jgi:hypothetical protein
MRKVYILWILIVPSILVGQKDTAPLFGQSLIKACIDTLLNDKDYTLGYTINMVREKREK